MTTLIDQEAPELRLVMKMGTSVWCGIGDHPAPRTSVRTRIVEDKRSIIRLSFAKPRASISDSIALVFYQFSTDYVFAAKMFNPSFSGSWKDFMLVTA